MRQLSFALRGKTSELAIELDYIIGQEVRSLGLSAENWEQLVIGLQCDPCPLLFRRLLDGVKVDQAVQLLSDGTLNGKLVLLSPERLRVGFELGGYGSLRVTIGFDPDHMAVAAMMTAKFCQRQAAFIGRPEAVESAVTR